jgi:hypothetical protein
VEHTTEKTRGSIAPLWELVCAQVWKVGSHEYKRGVGLCERADLSAPVFFSMKLFQHCAIKIHNAEETVLKQKKIIVYGVEFRP